MPCPPFQSGCTRLKINAAAREGQQVPFAASGQHARPAASAVSAGDVVKYANDEGDWTIQNVNAEWLIRALESYLAGVDIFAETSESTYINRLAMALDAAEGVVNAVHPLSMILAVKG